MATPLPADQRALTLRQQAALKKQWNEKLRESGFYDVEYQREDGAEAQWLRSPPDLRHRDMEAAIEWQSQMQEYAAQATWDKPKDKLIYELVASGMSYRKISAMVGLNICTMSYLIQEHEKRRKEWWAATEAKRELESKKRGRPQTRTKRERRNRKVTIRFSDREAHLLSKLAVTFECTPTEALREIALRLADSISC